MSPQRYLFNLLVAADQFLSAILAGTVAKEL